MSTNHFNQLSEGEAERLAILAEECSEVIQIVCKIQRHGYESDNNGKLPENNRRMLERELGDLGHTVARMENAADVNPLAIRTRAISRPEHVKPYLHHQEPTA